MTWFDALANRRIEEAERAGAFRGLAGAGEPLDHTDYFQLPRALRPVYGLLKAQGWVPEEFEVRREIRSLEDLVGSCTDPDETRELRQQLRLARLRLDQLVEHSGCTPALREYREQLLRRL